jgi:hypothetical protein
LDGIFRFIIKLGMNPVLDGQTRALKFIHYRDETNEPGFLLPYVRVFFGRNFQGSLLNCG